ncbi:MAG TPA: hypothetical protein VHH13_01745, partial [Arthrobacter sp.]|nr:hypothetical protein [Arthrobacter sp.]
MTATLGAALSIGLLAAPFAALPAVANEHDPEPIRASSPAAPGGTGTGTEPATAPTTAAADPEGSEAAEPADSEAAEPAAEAPSDAPADDQQVEPQDVGDTYELNLLGINDFHGRIDENTVKFAGTVEQLRAQNPGGTLFTSAGDNIGASLFASASQDDQPTIDVLNALELAT